MKLRKLLSKRRLRANTYTQRIYLMINGYYYMFESYRTAVSLRNWSTLLALAGLAIFAFCIVDSYHAHGLLNNWLSENGRLTVIALSELFTLICWFVIQLKRDQQAVERAQKDLDTAETALPLLKGLWFKKYVSNKPSHYLQLAKDLDDLITLKNKHKSPFSFGRNELFAMIFTGDAKNRILAMFMGVCAIVTALLIAEGANVSTLFSIINGGQAVDLFYVAVLYSVVIMAAALTARLSFNFVLLVFDYVIDSLDGLNSRSIRRSKLFLNQLLQLYTPEKPRHRVRAGYQSTPPP